jgi:hypothetical protein
MQEPICLGPLSGLHERQAAAHLRHGVRRFPIPSRMVNVHFESICLYSTASEPMGHITKQNFKFREC